MSKPLTMSAAAARWLHDFVHTPGFGIRVDDRHAATEAIDAIDRYVKALGPPPAGPDAPSSSPAPPAEPGRPNGGARR